MLFNQVLLFLLLVLWVPFTSFSQSEAESRAAWAKLQRQPLTETTFQKSCDLIQDIGQTNLKLAYELLAQYVLKVQKTSNQQWLHVLLINWGDSYTLHKRFDKAEVIFRQARQNAQSNPRLYGQALVYTLWLYWSWDKPDSVSHYLALSEPVARQANDRETLAFLYLIRGANPMRTGNQKPSLPDYDKAIELATGLRDKNVLFTARANKLYYFRPNPVQQMAVLDSLLTLTSHPSLAGKPRFYRRTTFYHRNPRSTVLYELIDLNLLLADYENAGRFADMLQHELVRLGPNGSLAPFLNAQLSAVRCQQGRFAEARKLLTTSQLQFKVAEASIPSLTYFLAAGLLAEHNQQYKQAVWYYRQWMQKDVGPTALLLIPPEIFYARALLHIGQYAEADQLLATVEKEVAANQYTAVGLYFFQTVASLRKAQNDLPGYSRATDTYQAIQTWLTRLNQYRAVQKMVAQMRIRDKEQQIDRLNAENTARTAQIQRERLFYGAILALALLTIGLLMLYLRNRQVRTRQRELLQQSQLIQLEQHRKMELLQSVMQAEENERRKIADQLHDEVNAMLALASLNVSSVLERGPQDSQSGPKLEKTQAALLSVSATVRGISHRLTPFLIEQFGFRRAIDDLAESVNVSGRLRLDTNVVGFDDPGQPSLGFLNELYRIIQELVHNILKHAQATEASVEVVENGPFVTLMVEDNGVGIKPENQTDGMGLSTIRSKVAYLGGIMEIQPKPGGGTLVVIDQLRLPEQIPTTMHTIN